VPIKRRGSAGGLQSAGLNGASLWYHELFQLWPAVDGNLVRKACVGGPHGVQPEFAAMNEKVTSKDPDYVKTRAAAELVERARALAPTIAAAAPQIEALRELTPEVVAALHDAGLFRMLTPHSLGGREVELSTYIQAIEEIAKADASAAWCIAQTSVASTIAASLDHGVAWEMFGADPRAVLAMGPPGTVGKAVATNDGYRISGTWQFASGSRHASWLAAHCPVYEPNGAQRLDASGMPVDVTLVFPKSRATMTDVWHVIGLKGSGSDSYSAADLFVPASHSMTAFARNPAERRERGPLYQFTVFQLFGASFASIALGIARTTLDAFIELAKKKSPAGAKYLLRDNAVIQSQIGLAQSQLTSARVFLHHALGDIWQGALAGNITIEQRIQLRMASSHASHQAKQVVDTAYHAAGATAIFESNPFERRFRDVHTVSQQVQAHFSVFEAIGQHYLGLPLHPRLI
jgi:alkylation response protein AidB-like acyl-CoA dehydrogenase